MGNTTRSTWSNTHVLGKQIVLGRGNKQEWYMTKVDLMDVEGHTACMVLNLNASGRTTHAQAAKRCQALFDEFPIGECVAVSNLGKTGSSQESGYAAQCTVGAMGDLPTVRKASDITLPEGVAVLVPRVKTSYATAVEAAIAKCSQKSAAGTSSTHTSLAQTPVVQHALHVALRGMRTAATVARSLMHGARAVLV